ncbi:MAG: hypothetical protein ACTHMX_08015, partial [Thermomicrobiales bacterium]
MADEALNATASISSRVAQRKSPGIVCFRALAGASRHVHALEKDPAHAAAVERQLATRRTANVTDFAAHFLDFP